MANLSKDRSKNDVFVTKGEAMGICDLCEAYFDEDILPYIHAFALRRGKVQYLKEEVVEAYMTLAVIKVPTKKLPRKTK